MLRSPRSLQHHHLLFHHSFRHFEDAGGHFRSYCHHKTGLNSINAHLPPLRFSFSQARINLQFKSIQALVQRFKIKLRWAETKLAALFWSGLCMFIDYEQWNRLLNVWIVYMWFNFQMFYYCELSGKVVVCDFLSDLQANHMSIFSTRWTLGFDPVEEVKRKFRKLFKVRKHVRLL